MKINLTILKNALPAFLLFTFVWVDMSAQVTTPRPASPASVVKQTIGLSTIAINYSRPSVREREIWGALVPYGYTATGSPWRAGANENTTISFSDNAKIEGQDIPAGTYGFFVAVHENGKVDVIFSKNSTSWGSFSYKEDEDQLKVTVDSEDIENVEMLTYDFVNIDNTSAIIVLDWEKKRIPFKVEYDVNNIVLANARNELRSIQGFNFQGPLSAANYCLQNNINHEEALKWVDQAIANTKNFNTLFVKAGLLQQTDSSDATSMYDEAAEFANIGQLNFMGYQLVGRKEYDKALEYFKLNVERNPEDANVHDSLGECYKTMGDNTNAIKELKKSLSLNPPANVKANSIKLLKEMGVDTSEYDTSE